MGFSSAFLIISTTLHVFVMCHTSPNYEGPTFTVEPDAMIQFSNATGAVVPCGADGRPPPTVHWVTTDGQVVRDVSNLRRTRHDGSLTFLPFTAEDYRADVHATLYRCVAVNTVGSIYSRDVNVRAVVPQHFDIRLSDEFVMRGNMAILRCPLPSYVQDYVRVTAWERSDGFLIAPEAATGKYGMIGNGDLYLLDSNEHDSKDSFKCHTENSITKEKKTSSNYARVIVTEPLRNQLPRIIRRSDRDTIGVNERGTLYCLAQGYPPPAYRWLRQSGHRLTVPDFGASVRQEGGILVFHRAKPSDSGRYVCLVTNSVGEDRAESELEVVEPLKVSLTPVLLKVEVGQSASLRCEVFGSQEAKTSWRKDTQILVPDLRNVLFPNSTSIRILHVRREDAGMYQCFARLGTDTAQSSARIVIGDLAPTFRTVFTEQILRPGSYISLICSVSGSPPPEVTWSLDGIWPVSTRPGLVVGSYVALDSGDVISYVNVSSVDVSDGGVYSCTASNEAGTSSHSARLNIYGPLTVRRMSGNVSALAGKSLNVICPFGGYPFQGIRWKKDGRLLPVNQRQIVHLNGSLVIADVQRGEDDGHYSCEVTSRQGPSASGTFYVSVRTGPRVSPFKFEENLHEGMRTAVTCVVSAGDTPFTIRWSKDGVPLKDGVLGSAIHYPENGFVSTLSINKLAYRHNGKYTCLASNDVDTGSYTAILTVKVPPRWVLQPKDTSAVAGRPARIDCQADGVPQPHVRWKKASGHLPNDFKTIVSSSHVHILVNGSLNFQHVEMADEGHYVCEANNGVGNGLNAVIRFVVHSAPQFYSNFAGLTTKRGQRTKIECVAKGEKPMLFTWRKNGEPLDTSQDSRYSVDSEESEEGETTRLVISKSERQDTALFTCVASNEYGQDTTNVQLTVRDIPDAPQNLEVHEASSRSVRLTWNRPFDGNSPITKYTVAWRQVSGQASGGPLSVAGGETTMTVRGLTPSTRYFFRVKCENELGQSQFGAEVAVTTLEEPPRVAPTLVQAVPVTSRSINVTWQIPIEQDGTSNIEGFYVGYKPKNSPEPYTFVPSSISLATSQQHAIVHDLHRYTEYGIVVQAFNTRGAGPPSEEVIARTLEFDPPASPVVKSHSVTSSTIKLLWELHDFPDSPVTGCILYHRTEDDDWHETHLTGQRTGYTLHGLKCGTTYLCYVVAFNSAGSSNASKIVSIKTEGSPPIAADKRSLLTTNSSSVLLHLRSFKDGGCPILTFIIWYKLTENRQDWVRYGEEVHRDRKDVAIVGLRPGTWYTLRVSARNDAGVTDAEYDFATLTLEGEFPPRPTQLSGGNGSVYRHLTITLPVVGLAFLFVVILCSICLATRRRYLASRLRTPDEAETSGSSKPEQLPLSVTYEGAHDPSYFPAPYATGRIYQQGSYRGRDPNHRCPPSEKHPELDQFENHPATGRSGEIFCPQRQSENYTAPAYEKPVIYFPSYHQGALRGRQEEAIYEVPDRGRMKQNSGNWRSNGDGNSSTESDNEEVHYTWHPPEVPRDDARESETECDRLWKAYQESQYEGRKRWPDGHLILS